MAPAPPYDLKCEYLRNPLGMDVPAPRFSWLLRSDIRGDRQTACQVIVSSEAELCRNEVGDFWDSEKVETEKNSQVVYQGEPFLACARYHWRVRWWNAAGEVSPWSEAAVFETGFMGGQDWKAKWISAKSPREFESKANVFLGEYQGKYIQHRAIYLRREFEAGGKIARASAYICGLGYYELFLNGLRVGDRVLEPAWTDYHKNALYSTYDVTTLLTGKNAVGVVLGSGRHIKNFGYGPPRMIFRLEIEYETTDREIVISDENWRAAPGPVQENGIYFGEKHDGRLEVPGWSEAGYDDSSWEKAIPVAGYPLFSQMMPPIRVETRLKAQRFYPLKPGVYIYDFGQNFTGWVRLKAQGPKDTEIRLRHAELVFEDGSLNTQPNENAEAEDVYTLKGEGVESFEPKFTYHGFRHVELAGFPGEPALDTLEGCFVHTDVERTGEFLCSNELINKIHQNVLWGQLSNLMSIPTDCPQRDERHGWLGDAHLSAEEAVLNFDMAAFYTKYLDDIRLSQKEDGSLPDTVPAYLPRLYPADPAWGSAYGILIWLMYEHYGDLRAIEKHFLPLKRYVEFLRKNAEEHLIKKLGKYGDWCPPGSIVPKKTPLELTSTWFYYQDVLILSKMAALLSRVEDQRAYAKLAEDIKNAFNRAYLQDDQYASLRVSPIDKYPNQTSNVLPLWMGMVPPENKEKVIERLRHSVVKQQDYHVDTGILGTRYLLDVLTENGYPEVAYRVAVQKSYPGWGYMVQEGATTLWERWEKLTGSAMNSHNHIMLGSVDAWFYKTVAGLSRTEAGWKKIRIKPFAGADLTSASASIQTMRGEISVLWRKEDKSFRLEARIPVGSEVEVYLPFLWDNASVQENGKVLWQNGESRNGLSGIACLGVQGNYLVFSAGSGSYVFLLQKTD